MLTVASCMHDKPGLGQEIPEDQASVHVIVDQQD